MKRLLLDQDLMFQIFPQNRPIRMGEYLDLGNRFNLEIQRESSMKWVVKPKAVSDPGDYQRELRSLEKLVTLYSEGA